MGRPEIKVGSIDPKIKRKRESKVEKYTRYVKQVTGIRERPG